jgi:hypothetical protein
LLLYPCCEDHCVALFLYPSCEYHRSS